MPGELSATVGVGGVELFDCELEQFVVAGVVGLLEG